MVRRAVHAGASALLLLWCQSSAQAWWDEDEEDGPVEYVRICDAFGTGYYYIPGTETALRIGGYVRAVPEVGCTRASISANTSILESSYNLGVGTVRFGLAERFGLTFGDYTTRYGGEIKVESAIGRSDGWFGLGEKPALRFFYGSFEMSGGSNGGRSSHSVGAGGADAVAATLLEPDGVFGTGWIASAPGFGLESSGSINNSWAIGNVGLGHTFQLEADEQRGTGSAFVVRTGIWAEGIDYSGAASADLTFGGAPFAGYFQDFDYATRDRYFGLKFEGTYVRQFAPQWQVSLGANIFTGYHDASGYMRQDTGFGGPIVTQTHTFSNDGWVVGGGLSVGLEWQPAPGWAISTALNVDYVPDVTGYIAPENPLEQPGRFVQDDAWRVNWQAIRITRSF